MVWNTTTPRDHSPCGAVLDRNATLLFDNPHRHYPQLLTFRPLLVEGLLVPFYVNNQPVGTIWAVAHDEARRFDAEDRRLLESLAAFAAIAYQTRLLIAAQAKANESLEEEVQRSEERFARFMRHLPGSAWMKDLTGRYVYTSEAVERLVGARPGELLGKSDDDILPPQTAVQLKEHDTRALAEDAGVLVTETLGDPQGNPRHYLVSKFPIRGPDGEVSLIGGMAFEITDRLRSEQALQSSEERFTRFMRHLPGLAWIKDSAGRYVYANDHTLARWRAIGVPGALGLADDDFIPPAIAAQVREEDRRVLTTRTAAQSVHGFEEPDGSRTYWLVTKFPIAGHHGDPPLVGGVAIDITEQARAERVLREQAELLDLATDAILILDPSGKITYWNRGAERLYGWGRGEALGQNVRTLLRTEFPQPLPEIMAEVLRSGHWEGELTHTRRDGLPVVVSSHWNPRLDGNDKLAEILEISTDVTARKQATEMREQFVGRLIAAQEEERGRAARELHDGVAQTLTALHLRAEALAARAALPEVRDELADLKRLAQGAAEEVRFLARGLRPPVLDEFGLLPALTRYAEDFTRTHGIAAEVVASGRTDGRLPPAVETALYRITQEALANVARHSGATAVSIVLLHEPSFVQLLVEDNGAGWAAPPDAADPYFHLGLAGMRERAALLGGTVSVESSADAGVAVSARVPLPERPL
jgi:PAS domain S-box-containing protein